MFSSSKPPTGHRYRRLNNLYDNESVHDDTTGDLDSNTEHHSGRGSDTAAASDRHDDRDDNRESEATLFTNLDLLCTRTYRYYSYGGARNFALSRAAHIIKLTFALSVAFLLTSCIDYERMRELLAESTSSTHDNQPYHIDASEFVYYGAGGGLSFFSFLLYGGFSLYIVWLCVKATRDVRCLVEIGHFCRTRLHLTYRDMQTCEWSEVCERLLQVPELRPVSSGAHSRNLDRRTELDIVNRIMRRENYLIALLNLNVLAWSDTDVSATGDGSSLRRQNQSGIKLLRVLKSALLAFWKPLFVATTDFGPSLVGAQEQASETEYSWATTDDAHNVARPSHCSHPFFTRTLEWALHFALFSLVFDARTGALRTEFEPPPPNTQGRYAALQKMARTLRWRFRVMAVLGFLLCPFVLVYILFDFFLQHSEQFRQRSQHQNVLTTRRWSNEARWAIREFNELPHLFERRLDAAHQHASLYLSQFSSTVTLTLARLLVYCAGGAIGVLLLLGFLGDDEVLTRVNIAFGRSGVWWLSVLGVLVAAARSAIPPDNLVHDPRGHMRRCVEHTHYMPETWRNREHTGAVRDRFARLFEFRWLQGVREMLGIFYTPYLLWSFLPRRSEALVRFFRNYSVRLRDCGHVCRFAIFRLDQDGDPRCAAAGSKTGESENDSNDSNDSDRGNNDGDFSPFGAATASSASLSSLLSSRARPHVVSRKSTQRPYHGKLEASVLSFRSEHPLWRAEPESGCDEYVEILRRQRPAQQNTERNKERGRESEQQQQRHRNPSVKRMRDKNDAENNRDDNDNDNNDNDAKRWVTNDPAPITEENTDSWRQTIARFGELVQEEFGDARLPHANKSNGTLPI